MFDMALCRRHCPSSETLSLIFVMIISGPPYKREAGRMRELCKKILPKIYKKHPIKHTNFAC